MMQRRTTAERINPIGVWITVACITNAKTLVQTWGATWALILPDRKGEVIREV